jgi:hypothetical protein
VTRARRLILAGLAALSLLSSVAASFAQVPAPVPALPDAERRTSYSITASTCACSLGASLALYGDANDYWNWVEVYLNGTRVNYNDATFGWTITSPSGSLSTLARPITDAVLTFRSAQTGTVQIVGARRPRRVSQFSESAGVPARNVNQVVTDITATLREMWDKTNDMTGRGLFSQPGNTVGLLPPPSACANTLLGFDSTGLNPVCTNFAGFGSVGASLVWAGPTSGSNALPTFRPLVPADLPALTGDVTTPGTSFAATIAANAVTNAKMAQSGAATIKGNPTSATANEQDFTVQGLPDISAPNSTLDYILIYNHTTGTLQKTTASELTTAVGSGVTSFNGRTGAVLPGSSDYIASQIGFTQNGTGATGITLDTMLRARVFTPEMFGATPSPYVSGGVLTPAGSVTNNQTQIQAAINALAAIGGGTLQFTDGVYGIGNGITAGNNIILRGSGVHNTTLLLQPTVATSAVAFSNGAIVSNCGITDLSINSADTTTTKNGITFVDTSQCFANNIMISAYPNGQWTATSAAAVGINTQGRELGVISNMQIYADTPIRISTNPHFAGGTEDLDSWSFRDNILVAPQSSATTNVITVDAVVAIFNTHFEGHQNWIGGVDGFHWLATNSAASFGLYISGIKDEQAGASGGHSVFVDPSSGLYGLSIKDSLIGVRNAIEIRNVNNTVLSNVIYSPGGASNNMGLNADLTNSLIDFSGCSWITGTTASLGAFSTSALITPTGFSTVLPASGVYYH